MTIGPRVTLDARYLRLRGVGITVYVEGVIETLLQRGANLTLLTDSDEQAAALGGLHPGCQVVSLPDGREYAWENISLPRYLGRSRTRAHIAPANLGLPVRRQRDVHSILIVHDLIPLRFPRQLMNARWGPRYLFSTAVSVSRADTIVANSLSTARDVERLFRRRNVLVRYPRFHHPAVERGRSGLRGPYLLYNGGMGERKNVDRLLQAFAAFLRRHPGHRLVLVGRGFDALRERIGQLGLDASVERIGLVDEAAKWAAIADADAVIYPSLFEGFGLPVIEALALGIPVVTGTGGALREVGGEAAIYVDVRNVADIAAGMERAISREERERAARSGPEHVRGLDTAEDPIWNVVSRL